MVPPLQKVGHVEDAALAAPLQAAWQNHGQCQFVWANACSLFLTAASDQNFFPKNRVQKKKLTSVQPHQADFEWRQSVSRSQSKEAGSSVGRLLVSVLLHSLSAGAVQTTRGDGKACGMPHKQRFLPHVSVSGSHDLQWTSGVQCHQRPPPKLQCRLRVMYLLTRCPPHRRWASRSCPCA